MHIASIKRGLGPRRNEMAELEFSAKQGLTNFGALQKFLGQQVDLMVERIRKGEWPDRRDYLENCRADQDRDSFIQTVCSECRITYCTRKEANGAAD